MRCYALHLWDLNIDFTSKHWPPEQADNLPGHAAAPFLLQRLSLFCDQEQTESHTHTHTHTHGRAKLMSAALARIDGRSGSAGRGDAAGGEIIFSGWYFKMYSVTVMLLLSHDESQRSQCQVMLDVPLKPHIHVYIRGNISTVFTRPDALWCYCYV